MKKTERLGKEKITKLLMEFSIPATIGMLVNALYNIVDRIFIGNSPDLGPLGIAAITVSFPLTLILMSIALLFGVGGATLFSIKLGEKRPDQAEKYLGNAVLMLLGSSILFTFLSLLFLEPILILFGASPQMLPLAMEYMGIVLWGSMLQALSMGLNNFMRADGSPKLAMLTMFFGAGFNILFDPIFIYGFRWGMTGAALATVGGQMVTAVWLLAYFTSRRASVNLKLKNLKPEISLIRKIMKTGTPSFLRQISNSLMNVTLNKGLMMYGGDIPVSAIGAINSLQTFMIMPVFGIVQGAQPIIGYNFGARQRERVKEALKWAIYAASAVVIVGWLLTRIFPDLMMRMFSKDEDLLAFGVYAIKIWFFCLPLVGFQIVSASYFQAVGRAGLANFLTASRQLLIFIPAIIVLPLFFGLNGILYAAPLADFLSAIVTGIWLWVELKHLNSLSPAVVTSGED